ncbi:MAG: Gfo/Idh/MocA family oxidoreductase [Thermotogae bacterium]|nr:Gfo/Idh/MocA family oxidoreductase [Thermotogota bacterium]
MRIAVIGACGKMGLNHVRNLQTLGCEVYGVDKNPELVDIARKEGFHSANLEEIPNLGLDGVVVSIPPSEGFEICKKLLSMNMKVLCEKPVTADSKTLEKLIEIESESEGWIMVGFNMRYNNIFIKIRDIIKSGELGEIIGINAKKCWRAGTEWRLKPGGGVILIKDIHYFDLIPWLTGLNYKSVLAIGGNKYHNSSVEDHYFLLANLDNNIPFNLISAWWTYERGDSYFEVLGTKKRVFVSKDSEIYIAGAMIEKIEVTENNSIITELTNFFECITNGKKPVSNLENAKKALRIAECVKTSLNTGRVISVS